MLTLLSINFCQEIADAHVYLSGAEPLVRIMVEGEQESQVNDIAKYLAGTVEQFATK